MITEPFAGGDSQLHRLDPRVKILLVAVYSTVVSVCTSMVTPAAALVVSVFLVLQARLDLLKVGRRLLVVNGLIFFFWLVLPLTFSGEPLFRLGPWDVSRQGVLLSARITLKSNAIVLAFIALVATSSMVSIGHALHKLGLPDKMAHLFLLTYRYVFVLEQEYARLWRAARVRAFHPGSNLLTYRTLAYLLGMLLVRACARGERVHQAMVCRGFEGRFVSLKEFNFVSADWCWSAGLVFVTIVLAVLEWGGITW